MKCSQTLIDDEFESSNVASQKELGEFLVISISVTLGIPIKFYINCGPFCNKNLKNITGIIGDGHGNKIRIMGKNYGKLWKE